MTIDSKDIGAACGEVVCFVNGLPPHRAERVICAIMDRQTHFVQRAVWRRVTKILVASASTFDRNSTSTDMAFNLTAELNDIAEQIEHARTMRRTVLQRAPSPVAAGRIVADKGYPPEPEQSNCPPLQETAP